jgi:hypothetical protein
MRLLSKKIRDWIDNGQGSCFWEFDIEKRQLYEIDLNKRGESLYEKAFIKLDIFINGGKRTKFNIEMGLKLGKSEHILSNITSQPNSEYYVILSNDDSEMCIYSRVTGRKRNIYVRKGEMDFHRLGNKSLLFHSGIGIGSSSYNTNTRVWLVEIDELFMNKSKRSLFEFPSYIARHVNCDFYPNMHVVNVFNGKRNILLLDDLARFSPSNVCINSMFSDEAVYILEKKGIFCSKYLSKEKEEEGEESWKKRCIFSFKNASYQPHNFEDRYDKFFMNKSLRIRKILAKGNLILFIMKLESLEFIFYCLDNNRKETITTSRIGLIEAINTKTGKIGFITERLNYFETNHYQIYYDFNAKDVSIVKKI